MPTAECTERAQRAQRTGGGAPALIDVEGLAHLLQVDVAFVRRLVSERRIPYLKVGKYVRFDLAEVAAWLDERRVTAEPDHPAWGGGR